MEQNKSAIGAALLLGAPLLLLMSLLFILGIDEDDSANPCATDSNAVAASYVDPATVPTGPVVGYSGEQLVNAANVMKAAADMGLTLRDQQIGVMTAMGESGLRVIDYGDAAGPDSRGLFQQRDNGAWGSYSDRMNPYISATNFFKVEKTIAGRATMAPTLVAHAVQRNSSAYYYERFWDAAVKVVAALSGQSTSIAPAAFTTDPQPFPAGDIFTGADAPAGGCYASAGSYADGTWAHPIPGAPVTSGFGPRGAPVAGASSWHLGTDYGAACGTPFHAASGGVVISAGPASGYGHWIRIDSGNGVVAEYGHMYANGILVKVGDKVAGGQTIGLVGSDGASSGCHLHLTIRVNGTAVDPEKFLASAPAAQIQNAAATGGSGGAITVASFNVLGASHTDGNPPERTGFADSTTRAKAMARFLVGSGVGIVGFQEFQPTQQRVFAEQVGNAWATYALMDNAVSWRTSDYSLVAKDQLTIPYFNGNPRQMPVVRLRSKATGADVVVISVHNPADIGGNFARYRAEAISRERAYVAKVRAAGIPVLLVGDFNDRDAAYCAATEGGALTTGAGGSNPAGPACTAPQNMPVDWVFGAGLRWTGFVIERSTMGSISDHPFVAARGVS
jgi:murein DD-endopeptidase MepM/ murein hydrolase activator NlpD/endonuclease/exonuclease/phosphatase family metal-dependent hydrolase